jgi:hypothetical protein
VKTGGEGGAIIPKGYRSALFLALFPLLKRGPGGFRNDFLGDPNIVPIHASS